MSEMTVPGYDVVELLGFGSGGEVWLALEVATGDAVALKRLRADADLAARDRLRREAAVLAGVEHPHVVRLRGAVGDGDSLVLVLDFAGGGSLARLLATRGRLTPGEVVTVCVPMAQALQDVHAQGLVHGDVTPANVLFSADGRPLLSDLGVCRLLGLAPGEVGGTPGYLDPRLLAGVDPDPASDVHGLAATCLAALTGAAPYDVTGARTQVPLQVDSADRELLSVLEAGLDPDAAGRPTARELARAVFSAARAAPLHLSRAGAARTVAGAGDSRPPAAVTHLVQRSAASPDRSVGASLPVAASGADGARHLRRPGSPSAGRFTDRVTGRPGAAGVRAWLVAAAVGLAAALVAVTGLAWAGAGPGTARPAPAASGLPAVTASPTQPGAPVGTTTGTRRWAAVLAELDARRSRAYAAGDLALLAGLYVPGSPAARRDEEALVALLGRGLRAEDLRLSTTAVRLLRDDGERAQLRVTDLLDDYTLVDSDGSVVQRRPGRGAASWTVLLQRRPSGWAVYDVRRG